VEQYSDSYDECQEDFGWQAAARWPSKGMLQMNYRLIII